MASRPCACTIHPRHLFLHLLWACLCLGGCSSPRDRDAAPPPIDIPFFLGDLPLGAIMDAEELPDGKLLVTGPSSGQLVCRLLPSGELDESFADQGCALQPGAFTNVKPVKVMVLSGEIVVFGTWSSPGSAPTETQGFYVRMSSGGVWWMISSGNYGDGAFFVEAMRQGEDVGDDMVVAGGTSTGAFLASSGYFFTSLGTSPARDALLLKGDRFIVSTGTTLHALDADGLPDPDFGLAGTVELPFEALTLASEGSEIVAAGTGMAIARVSHDGKVTETFDPLDAGAGVRATALDVTVDEDGSIILGGMVSSSGNFMALGRRKRSGEPDLHFGPGGIRRYSPGQAFDVEILRDGRYLLAGTRDGSISTMFVVARE